MSGRADGPRPAGDSADQTGGAARPTRRAGREASRGRSRHAWKRRSRLPLVIAATLLALAGVALSGLHVQEPDAAVDVDFGRPVAATPRSHIGFTATTLAVDGGPVVESSRAADLLRRLGAGVVRIHLRSRSDGTVVTGARGGDTDVPAARWLDTYCGTDTALVVVVDLNKATATDVLKYLRSTGCPVHRFVLGNEMDGNSQSDVSPTEYVRRFREIAKAMRSVDPTLEIGGPAPAYFEGLDPELVDGLLQAPPDERASFIDFHAYGAGRGEQATMPTSWRYAEQIDHLRAMINDPDVGVQVGEFNLSWAEDPRDNTPFQSVWVASALGTILSRGAVAIEYGDRNVASGLVSDDGPKPSYWGMAAFTGGGMFRPFGTTMVRSTTDDAGLRVFASTDEKNIVIVNVGDTRSAEVSLRGFAGGTAGVWQSVAGEFRGGAPRELGSRMELQLPGMSITTVVLDERR